MIFNADVETAHIGPAGLAGIDGKPSADLVGDRAAGAERPVARAIASVKAELINPHPFRPVDAGQVDLVLADGYPHRFHRSTESGEGCRSPGSAQGQGIAAQRDNGAVVRVHAEPALSRAGNKIPEIKICILGDGDAAIDICLRLTAT